MVILMPKKKPSKDGRSTRYIPLAIDEFRQAEKSLQTLYGYYRAICVDMEARGLESLQVDGRQALNDALENLLIVAKKAQGSLRASDMKL